MTLLVINQHWFRWGLGVTRLHDPVGDISTLVQVRAWCDQATWPYWWYTNIGSGEGLVWPGYMTLLVIYQHWFWWGLGVTRLHDPVGDISTLVQVRAWCDQATWPCWWYINIGSGEGLVWPGYMTLLVIYQHWFRWGLGVTRLHDPIGDKSTLVQVRAWCDQVTWPYWW